MRWLHPCALAALLAAACGGSTAPGGASGGGHAPGDARSGLFTGGNVWNTPVDTAPRSASSDAMLAALQAAGGFGTGKIQIDFSMKVLWADAGAPRRRITPASGFYLPDCDAALELPLPPGGALEGERGYACTGGGDCHLLVVDPGAHRLYELYQGNQVGAELQATCAVSWDLARSYPPDLRGDGCTSTDAAGLPVAALLFTADEVAAGSIDHAIRFILPNARMARGVYVRPATHAGAPSGDAGLPPYGTRLRLRADYPLARLPSDGARVVARALQRYGMILADGGSIALTAADDAFTAHAWSEVGVDSHALGGLAVSDFEVVDPGAGPFTRIHDCTRNGE